MVTTATTRSPNALPRISSTTQAFHNIGNRHHVTEICQRCADCQEVFDNVWGAATSPQADAVEGSDEDDDPYADMPALVGSSSDESPPPKAPPSRTGACNAQVVETADSDSSDDSADAFDAIFRGLCELQLKRFNSSASEQEGTLCSLRSLVAPMPLPPRSLQCHFLTRVFYTLRRPWSGSVALASLSRV